MKSLWSIFVWMGVLIGVFSSHAQARKFPWEEIQAKYLFVPVGFDDNDDVVVVVDGYLPNSCYKLAWVDVNRPPETNKLDVRVYAWHFDGPCTEVEVPFTRTVSLGTLSEGEYSVTLPPSGLSRGLKISRAGESSPDRYLYAPIDSARVASLLPAPGEMAVLEGRFTNSCLSIQEVKAFEHGETLELLPIMQLAEKEPNGDPCRKVERPFVERVTLPALTAGRRLLHVRSLNGQSINFVFTKE